MKNLKIKLLTLTLSFCIITTATAMEKQKNKEENTKNSTNTLENEEKKLDFKKPNTNNMCGFFKYMENVLKNVNVNNKTNKKQS